MDESVMILYKCIQARYVKVVWSHKIQEIQGDIYFCKDKLTKNTVCLLSCTTTGTASLSTVLALLNLDTQITGAITAILAICLSYFTIRFKDGQQEKKAKENKIFAAKLHDLRNKYESLMTDIKAGILNNSNEITARRDELSMEEKELYSEAPYTSRTAVNRANKALKIKRESTTEEDEIDAIVPKDLILH